MDLTGLNVTTITLGGVYGKEIVSFTPSVRGCIRVPIFMRDMKTFQRFWIVCLGEISEKAQESRFSLSNWLPIPEIWGKNYISFRRWGGGGG